MKRLITAGEIEKLRVSFSQKIAETKVSEINYEQHLVACILTASGPIVTQEDVNNALLSAEKVIKTMAYHQVAGIKEVEVVNG